VQRKKICYLLIPVTLALVFSIGCSEKKTTDEASTAGGIDSSVLDKTLNSACVAGSHPVVTGANRVQRSLTLNSNNTFGAQELWYTGGACQGANYAVIHFLVGAYAVSGSVITFHLADSTGSSIMAMTTTAQDNFNTACGATSPYIGGSNTNNNGVAKTTYTMLCQNISLPNSTESMVYNIFSASNGVLSIGTGTVGIPGVLSGTPPMTADIDYN